MIPDRASSTEDRQVLPFRRRGAPAGGTLPPRPSLHEPPTSVADGFAKYEGGAVDDNYRHRMMVNLAALAFTIMLAIAGAWLAITIADMRKNQDCYLSGRRNCTPIDTQALRNR